MSDFDSSDVARFGIGQRGQSRRPVEHGLGGSTSRRAPHPDSPAGRSMSWHERVGAEATDWLEEKVDKILGAHSTSDVLHLAKFIIGYEAFSLGFNYGLVSHPLSELVGLGELVKTFVLADVHEYFFLPMGAATRAMAPMGPGSALARQWLMAFNGPTTFRHPTETAYRQREEILAELKAVMSDPVAFLADLPGRMKDEYAAKWRQYQELSAKSSPKSQFEAGKIAGETTMEILLLLAGLIAAGATVAKIAGKVPRLLEWARALRTPKFARGGTGASFEALESSAVRSPKPVPKPSAPKPIVETTGTPEPLAPVAEKPIAKTAPLAAEILPMGGDVTANDIALATADGASEAQIVAREKVATQFYAQYGNMPPARSGLHVDCIDTTQPIRFGPPPPLAESQYQWRIPGRDTGQYFSDKGVEPTKLGILERGNTAEGAPVYPRILEEYKFPSDAPYLESTAAPAVDNFSIVNEPYQTEGGAIQRFIPKASSIPTKVL